MTNKRSRKETTRYWLRRLNVLLRFARVDPWKLNNGALEKLQGGMYFAVMGKVSPQEDEVFRPIFDDSATREALSEAQRGLDRVLQRLLVNPTTGLAALFRVKLVRQELLIVPTKGAVVFRFHTDHFPSQVYIAFAEAFKASGVKPSDILHCSHCSTVFVPLRKPRRGTPTYCSQGCAAVVASRNYRARQAKERAKKVKRRGKEEKKAGGIYAKS